MIEPTAMSEHTHIIQYSGGIGSFETAKWVKENCTGVIGLLFADTKIEDATLYTFLEQSAAYLQLPLIKIADGRTPWEVFKDVRWLGNTQKDPCSRILKRELCKKWVATHFHPEDCTIYVGIDWTEQHRMANVTRFWEGWNVQAPLVHIPYDKERAIQNLPGGITLPRLYSLGFPHNNCGGGCVKAGKAHFLHLLRTLPEVYAEWERNEESVRQHLGKDVSILRDRIQVGGLKAVNPLTLRALRERAEEVASTEDGQLEWGGCGCFST